MKQNYYIRYKICLIFTIGLFISCTHDYLADSIHPGSNETGKCDFSIEEAKAFFESNSAPTTRSVGQDKKIRGIMPADFTPRWNKAKTSRAVRISSVDVPIEANLRYKAIRSVFKSGKSTTVSVTVHQKLVVVKDATSKSLSSYILNLIPTVEYDKSHKVGVVDCFLNSGDKAGFSGVAMYYSMEGFIVRIDEYVDGVKTRGAFIPKEIRLNRTELVRKVRSMMSGLQFIRLSSTKTRSGEDDDWTMDDLIDWAEGWLNDPKNDGDAFDWDRDSGEEPPWTGGADYDSETNNGGDMNHDADDWVDDHYGDDNDDSENPDDSDKPISVYTPGSITYNGNSYNGYWSVVGNTPNGAYSEYWIDTNGNGKPDTLVKRDEFVDPGDSNTDGKIPGGGSSNDGGNPNNGQEPEEPGSDNDSGTDPGTNVAPKAKKIFRNSRLSEANWRRIENMLNRINKDCLGEALYNGILDLLNGKTIVIEFDPNEISAKFYYDRGKITLKDDESNALFHEMWHLFQAYQETSASFAKASANLEVECMIAHYRYESKNPENAYDTSWSQKFVGNPLGRYVIKLSGFLDEKSNFISPHESALFYSLFTEAGRFVVDFDKKYNPEGRTYWFDYNRENNVNLKNLLNLSSNC